MLPRLLSAVRFIILSVLLFPSLNATAQCDGSVGDPLVHIDFGSGTGFGPALAAGTTSFLNYLAQSCPGDGNYSIIKSTPGCWGGDWHLVNSDHTGNTNGYYMLINAAIAPSDFYIKTISGLCADTTYEVSFSILNIHKYGILPNITVMIEDLSGNLLSTYNTGPIPLAVTPTWITYSVAANVGTNTGVKFRLRNNAPGGIGNDFALDDIMFRPIGPAISLDVTSSIGGVANITTALMSNLEFTSVVGSCYTTNVYQWQLSADNGANWTDIVGAINGNYYRVPTGVGTYLYRLLISPLGSGGNVNCRVSSDPITVNVALPPTGCATIPTITTTTSCASSSSTIQVTTPLGANFTYSINGVNYQASPIFNGVAAGNFNITYKDLTNACTSPPNAVVIPPIVPAPNPVVVSPVYYCQNSTPSPLIVTALPGNTIRWYGTNATGGTASAIAPTPSTATVGTTTYYVSQFNGNCESNRVPIVVNVSAAISPQPQTNPFCDGSTPTSVSFDWSNVPGYLGYMYIYSIAGGPFTAPAFQYAPSNITINTPGPGMSVTFQILSVVGVPCVPPTAQITCHSTCVADITPVFNPGAIKTSYCQGEVAQVLPLTTNNAIAASGTWTPAVINTATVGTTTYTFNADDILFPCVLDYSVQITVGNNATPVFVGIPNNINFCQNATATVLPTTSDNGINGTWSPSVINTATLGGPVAYTFTPAIGQCATGATVVKNATISPNLVPVFIPAIRTTYCQGEVSVALPTITNNPTPITGTWNVSAVNTTTPGAATYTFTPNTTLFPCAAPFVLNTTVAPKIIPTFAVISTTYCFGQSGAPTLLTLSTNATPISGMWSPAAINTSIAGNTTYTFTPTIGQCAHTKTLVISILPLVTPTFAAISPICAGTVFTLPLTSNNVPPITGTWNQAPNNTTTTTYTFIPTAGQCTVATNTALQIQIIPKTTPNFAPIAPFCVGNTAPILSTTSPNGVEGTWNPAVVSNTQSGTYTFTPLATECANIPPPLTVTLIPRTVPTFAPIADFCSGTIAPMLPLISTNGINGTWNPAIIDNTISGQYIFTPDASECATTISVPVTVTQPVLPDFIDFAFCSGTTAPALSTVSPNGISGTWLPATIDNLVGGSYTFTPDALQCANPTAILVTINEATLNNVSYTVTTAFEDNQIITVLASGPGEYLYQLDYGPFQESPLFINVLAGTHSITVMDQNNCSLPITESDVLVINYPKYFTPNGDGFHDTWNIIGLEELDGSSIFIFDRYGKLLKQISPRGTGWDGTYNDRNMPSTDYWFTVEYNELQVKKEFKAHFSLKR
jgi:gliding motility-associated-like protein